MYSFPKAFREGHERQFEWSTSGTPVNDTSRQFAVGVHHAVNERFKVSRIKHRCTSLIGPGCSSLLRAVIALISMTMAMDHRAQCLSLQNARCLFPMLPLLMYVLISLRRCLCLNLLQEGRGSQYVDPFGVLRKLQHRDFKFNRIPETLVVDHVKKDEKAMSFHHLHLLGPGIVLQVIVTPRASFSAVIHSASA